MTDPAFKYTTGRVIEVGDYVGLDQLDGSGVINKGHVLETLVRGSSKARQYGCREGGVLVSFEDGDCQLWTVPDEHLVFLGEKSVPNSTSTGSTGSESGNREIGGHSTSF